MDVEESKRTNENEIDYILTNKKSIVKNVIQRVNVGSDHRIVRGTIRTNTRIERRRKMRPGKSKVNPEEFQLQLQNHFELLNEEGEEDVEEMVCKITNAIQESAVDTTGRRRE